MTRHAGARRAAVAALALVAITLVAPTSGAGTEPAATALPALTGNAPLGVDPVPAGEVAVVAESAPVRDRIAFVVQNGTDASVRVSRVTAVAERSGGTQATRASTTDVVPGRLAPGEQAIGEVRFRRGTIDVAPVVTWEVREARAPSSPDPTRLTVGDLVLSPPKGALVAQTLDLTLTNLHDRAVAGPLVVRVLCVNEAGRPAVSARAALDRKTLKAGRSVPVTVKLRELCPSYVVGGRASLAR